MRNERRLNVLGVGVSAVDMQAAVRRIGDWIDGGDREYVCVTGVHGVMESQVSDELRAIHNGAGMVTPDGMPLAWLLRLAGFADVSRVCGPDLMPAVFRAGESRGDRHFLYGATEAKLQQLEAGLLRRAPRAQIVGRYAPPFRPLTAVEADDVIMRIGDTRPDIVWIGLSTPKQERWMAEFRPRLNAPVLIGVGAAFDVHAGLLPRAPALMQRCGLEWLHRVCVEPRRLWRRYFYNNPRFLALLALQAVGLHRRRLD